MFLVSAYLSFHLFIGCFWLLFGDIVFGFVGFSSVVSLLYAWVWSVLCVLTYLSEVLLVVGVFLFFSGCRFFVCDSGFACLMLFIWFRERFFIGVFLFWVFIYDFGFVL